MSNRRNIVRNPKVENLEARIVLGFVWNAPNDEWPVPVYSTCCPGSPGISDTPNVIGKFSSSQTEAPVRHYDGLPVIFTDDLGDSLAPLGINWGHTRSWSGLNNSSLNGNGWAIGELPYVVVTGTVNDGGIPGGALGAGYLSGTENDVRLSVVAGGSTSYTFAVPTSSPYTNYAPWGDMKISLQQTPDPTPALKLTDANGNVVEFYDVRRDGSNKPITGSMATDLSSKYGKFKSYTSADGTVFIGTNYDGNGYLTSVTISDSVAGSVVRIVYAYDSVTNDLVTAASATPPELLETVTLERSNGSGGWISVRRTNYTYYTGRVWNGSSWQNDPNGRLGDLKLAEVQDAVISGTTTWETVDTKYYRYYKFTGETYSGGAEGPTNNSATTGGPAPVEPRRDMTYSSTSPDAMDAKVMSGLKTVIEGPSFSRMVAEIPNYDAASDDDIESYVNHFFKYERWADHVGAGGFYGLGADIRNSGSNYDIRIGYRLGSRYRVIEEIAQASGCSSCSGGLGTYKFSYTSNTDSVDAGYNTLEFDSWRAKTQEYMPDGTSSWADNDRSIAYTNELGQPLLTVFADVDTNIITVSSIVNISGAQPNPNFTVTANNHGFQTGDRVAISGVLPDFFNGIVTVTRIDNDTFTFQVPDTYYTGFPSNFYINQTVNGVYTPTEVAKVLSEHATYYRYNDDGRLIMTAETSAISGYDDTKSDLLDNVSGDYSYLRNSAGLITTYEYYTSTTATSSVAGGVDGLLKAVYVQQGETGTPVVQNLRTYYTHTAGGSTVSEIAANTVYGLDSGSNPSFTDRDPRTTSFAYTWFSGTNRIESVTVTEPTVTSGQNGPGTADTSTVFYDIHGRVIWSKDQAGFLSYTAYDTISGAVVKQITDVDTTQTSDFANLPSGWTTPSGGGLHLIDTFQVDMIGRTVQWIDPKGNVTWTVYNDSAHEVRVYRGWDASAHTTTGPIEVYRQYWPVSGASSGQRTVYTESLTTSATPTYDGTSNAPTGQETISASNIRSLARQITNNGGQVVDELLYFSLTGVTYATATAYLGSSSNDSSSGNYHSTVYGYDQRGRLNKTVTPSGTIYRTVYDALGRVVSEWVGTNDTGATSTNPAGSGSPNNMFKTTSYEYDGGTIGDSNLTRVILYPDSNSANQRKTDLVYDWRNRLVATKDGVESSESTSVNRPITFRTLNNLGQTTSIAVYDGDTVTPGTTAPSSSLRKAYVEFAYDAQGRVYQQSQYSVNQSTGALSTYALTTNTWYDRRGYAIKTAAPGGLVTKSTIDGAGRLSARYFTDGGGDSAWSDADDVTGDIVLNQQDYTYDTAGNLIFVVNRDRFHDNGSGDTGVLGTPTTGNKARVSYQALYYDKANRVTDSVNVGTNGGSSYTRPGSVPSRSNTVLVNSYAYDAAGRLETVTDPRSVVSKTTYDMLGRTTKTIEAYTSGTPTDSSDRTTEYTFNGLGDILTLKAVLPSSAVQTTAYLYAASPTVGSTFYSNDVLSEVRHPDKSTGAASATEDESVGYNTLGDLITSTDRNGTTHNYAYDVLGRMTSDVAATLGSGIDGAVRRLETTYDTLGQPLSFTSYDATSSGSIVNQVVREYNGLGQVTTEYQSHSGAVNTSTSPKVQYVYSEMSGGANHSRLTQVVYPHGAKINYTYGGTVDGAISRVTSAAMVTSADAAITSESYEYLGLDRIVKKTSPISYLTYIQKSGDTSANTDAGDQYTGLDRFGRVIDQVWRKNHFSDAVIQRYQYGYDRVGNRLFEADLVDAALSDLYEYDDLNQLTDFARGVLSDSNSDGILDTVASPSRTQAWDLDAMGNWQSLSTNGTGQSRTTDAQNQVTGVGSASLTFDANGSMTTDETGQQFVYDAWNRIVKVLSPSSVTKVEYAYDALSRRVEADSASMGTTHFYYSTGWQLLEERDGGTSASDVDLQYFWSIDYVDALTARLDYTSGTLTTTRYALHDAQWNVTAVGTTSSGVQSRYVYDPYGTHTQLTSSWGVGGPRPPRESIHLFQGGLRDYDTGLYHFRNRDYSPTLGRWTRNDPIGFEAGDTNLYRYVGNGPVNGVDPWGLEPNDPIMGFLPANSMNAGTLPRSFVKSDGSVGSMNTKSAMCQAEDTIWHMSQKVVEDVGEEALDSATGGISGWIQWIAGGFGIDLGLGSGSGGGGQDASKRDAGQIEFGQRRIGPAFGIDGRPPHLAGRSIDDVAADLRNKVLSPDDLPIHYFEHNGQFVSANSRSLAALCAAGLEPTIKIKIKPTPELLNRLGELPVLPKGRLPSPSIPVTPRKGDDRILKVIRLPKRRI